MRLVRTNLTFKDVQPIIKKLTDRLFERVPAGVGCKGFVKLNNTQFKEVVEAGAEWCIERGYGWKEDLEKTEHKGRMKGADASNISEKAVSRGRDQIGTLGSGNHYLEIQRVLPENIINKTLAKKWGLFEDQIVVMFHSGSRGFGHQIGTDYLQLFLKIMEKKYNIHILDRELACAPFNSEEGQNYYKAMQTGINMSLVNRQVILHRIREVFSEVFKRSAEDLEMHQLWDTSHNKATLEEHEVDGKRKKLVIHRKGATGSYFPGREELAKQYKEDGSPVIIGGSMNTGSYLLVGTPGAKETFCSTAHGSGRTMSRTQAKKVISGEKLQKQMEKEGIYVRTTSYAGLAEEGGYAYKDIDWVVDATEKADISKRVVRFIPISNVKG